jgi:uncharacterized protein
MSDALPGIVIGKADDWVSLALKMANRHGLIAGATGTGKTVTLQVLAEAFSKAGVPVFAADVKGDLSGISQPGADKDFLHKRAEKIGLQGYGPQGFPVVYWDVFGEQGHPIRATVSEMGPVLLSRLLDLNDVQEGVLNVAFRAADDDGLLLLDMKDLRAILAYCSDNADAIKSKYGNVSPNSVGAIQRALLTLENQGGDAFFGEPALDLADFMLVDAHGQGAINLLAADKLMTNPQTYATFLLWLMSELFEQLPEVGDLEKPKLVFFFDEAHLLFNDAPKSLLDRITQVVRLIRSKGVGIYFITQNPQDVPEMVLAQLGNRMQHALRAYTPKEKKAVTTAAESFRANPAFKTEDAITALGIGEALVSTLEKGGVPSMVQRTLILPPSGRVGPVTPEERAVVMKASPVGGKYDEALDRESAFEKLNGKAAGPAKGKGPAPSGPVTPSWGKTASGDAAPAQTPSPAPAEAAQAAAPAGPALVPLIVGALLAVAGIAGMAVTSQYWWLALAAIGGVVLVWAMMGQGGGAAPAGKGRATQGGAITDIFTGSGGKRQSVGEAATKSVVRSVASTIGREIARGVLGGMMGRRR